MKYQWAIMNLVILGWIASLPLQAQGAMSADQYQKDRQAELNEFNESSAAVEIPRVKDQDDEPPMDSLGSAQSLERKPSQQLTSDDGASAFTKYWRQLKNAPACFAQFFKGLYKDREVRDEDLMACYHSGSSTCETQVQNGFANKIKILWIQFLTCLGSPEGAPHLFENLEKQ